MTRTLTWKDSALAVLAGFLVVLGLYFGPALTGFVIQEQSYQQDISLVVSEDTIYNWTPTHEGELTRLALDGSLTNNGTVRIYLEHQGNRTLLFDSSGGSSQETPENGTGLQSVTGFAGKEEEKGDQNDTTGKEKAQESGQGQKKGLNTAPRWSGPDTLSINGSTILDLSAYASDPDNDTLAYFAASPLNVSIAIDGSEAILAPDSSFSGSRTAFFTVTDGMLNATQAVSLDITATVFPTENQTLNETPALNQTQQLNATNQTSLNSAPYWSGSTEFVMNGTLEVDLDTRFTDNESDSLTYTTGEAQNITITLSGSSLTLTADSTFNGTRALEITASDQNYSTTQELTLTILRAEQSQSSQEGQAPLEFNLTYGDHPLYDANNDGTESRQGVVDLTVASTTLQQGMDTSKLCTQWEVASQDTGQSTLLCTGSGACCTFLDLDRESDSWNATYFSTYNKNGETENNTVSARLVYHDVNLSLDNPSADIRYSDWQSRPVTFRTHYQSFEDACQDTCSLEGMTQSSYNLIFEIEGEATFSLDRLRYTVQKHQESESPVLLKNVSNLTIIKNRNLTLNMSEHFADPEGDDLTYSAYDAADMDVVFHDSMATLIPRKGFSGAVFLYLTASDVDSTTSTNIFRVDVDSKERLSERVEAGKPVTWVKRLDLSGQQSRSNVRVSIPKEILNLSAYEVTNTSLKRLPDSAVRVLGRAGSTSVQEFRKERQLDWVRDKKALLQEARQGGAERVMIDERNITLGRLSEVLEELDQEETALESELSAEEERASLSASAGVSASASSSVISSPSRGSADNESTLRFDNLSQTAQEVEVEYTTPSPAVVEDEQDGRKQVTISSDYPYTDVFVGTDIAETDRERISVYWLRNNSRQQFQNVSYLDTDLDGRIDRLEWYVPHLSTQTFEIIIEISAAQHLDSAREYLEDIYAQVSQLDGVWSPAIQDGEYVRVTFERPLDSSKDITFHARNNDSDNVTVEVYTENGTDLVTGYAVAQGNATYKRYLTGLNTSTSVFDLKIVGGALEFDHIIDPIPASVADSNLPITRSLRFNNDDNTHLNTSGFGAPTSQTDFTYSVWVKRGNLGSLQSLLYGGDPAGSTYENFRFDASDRIQVGEASSTYSLVTSSVYRDPSDWQHITLAFDTDNAAESERIKIFVDGARVTAFDTETYPSSGYASNFTLNGEKIEHVIGANSASGPASQFFDGYLADVHFIDGQALNASEFGRFNDAGDWIPRKYRGTYGNNGFYLPFNDTVSVGKDFSGNANNFQNNSVGTGDQVRDTPFDNYATLNPLNKDGDATLSDGNLDISITAAGFGTVPATIFPTSGKYYVEGAVTGTNSIVGLATSEFRSGPENYPGAQERTGAHYDAVNGNVYQNGTGNSYGNTFSDTTVGIAWDVDNKLMWVALNGTWQGTGDPVAGTGGFNLTGDGPWTPAFGDGTSDTSVSWETNFGQASELDGNSTTYTSSAGGSFVYAPPEGFKALSSQNLPQPNITISKDYFDVRTYNGTGAAYSIDNLSFSPDLVWIKNRKAADGHKLLDTVRGATKVLNSSGTDAEVVESTGLTSFDSNGFTLGTGADGYNDAGEHFVAWAWKNSTEAGIEVINYTGNGKSHRNITHSLGTAPNLIVIKSRDNSDSGTGYWGVFHSSLGGSKGLKLAETDAAITTSIWADTEPTERNFSVDSSHAVNKDGDGFIAYLFSEKDGFSAFGNYTGNGDTDGAFVYTGFKPRYVIVKRTDSTSDWTIYDTLRTPYNGADDYFLANLNSAEATNGNTIDILSNGFKLRNSASSQNADGGAYIYIAFAEHPFKPDIPAYGYYSKFDGLTTDFDAASNISNVCGAILESQGNGLIRFNACINASNADFDTNINITDNLIKVEPAGLPDSIDSSANLTIANLKEVDEGQIMVDPENDGSFHPCGDCHLLSSTTGGDGTNVTFNVSGFSSYKILNSTNLSTLPLYPRHNENVTFIVNASREGVASVNFTLLDPAGTKVIDGLNGSNPDDGQLWNVTYNISSYGTWLWNASVFYDDGFISNSTTQEIILMEITLNLNDSETFNAPSVALSGHINLSNGTNLSNKRLYPYLDGEELGAAGSTVDTDFSSGTAINTSIYGVGGGANLTLTRNATAPLYPNQTGNFTSRIFDAQGVENWTGISWEQEAPYQVEIGRATDDGSDTLLPAINISGLVLLLHFNNESAFGENATGGEGDRVYDFSVDVNGERSIHHNGTTSGFATINRTVKKLGAGAAEFDGDNSYIEIVDRDGSLNITGPVTMMLWMYMESYGGSGVQKTLFSKNDTASLTWGFNNYGGADAFHGYSPCEWQSTTGIVSSYFNKWTHVALTYDKQNIRLYINGQENVSKACTSDFELNSTNLHLGWDVVAQPNINYFDGKMDEVAIWNRSLSSEEVKNIYKRGALTMNLSTRVSNDSVTWSGWSETYPNSTFSSLDERARYLQYQAVLSSDDANLTPVLESVSLNYTGLFTDSQGDYNFTFTAPGTAGSYRIKVNSTYADTIPGEQTTTLTVSEGATFSKFDVPPSTDLDTVGDITNVCGSTLAINEFGRIDFDGCINYENADLDLNVNLSGTAATVNTNILHSSFDTPANITLYNIAFEDPLILRDGVTCDNCTQLTYSGGTLKFNVTGFSTYSVVEGKPTNYTTITSGTGTTNPVVAYSNSTLLCYRGETGEDYENAYYKYYVNDDLAYTAGAEDEKLVLHFDEGKGQVVYDAAGTNDGLLGGFSSQDANDSFWTDGKFGKALGFDGVDDFATSPDPRLSNTSFTIAWWAKGNTKPNLAPQQFMWSINVYKDADWPANLGAQWEHSGQDRFRFNIPTNYSPNYEDLFVSNTNYPADEWIHFAMTLNRSNGRFDVYVDGSPQANLTNENFSSSVGMDAEIRLGNPPTSAGHFNGSIDEFLIFNRSLSASEIQDIYRSHGPHHSLDDAYLKKGDNAYCELILGNSTTTSFNTTTISSKERAIIDTELEDWNTTYSVNINLTNRTGSLSLHQPVLDEGDVRLLLNLDDNSSADKSIYGNDGTKNGVTFEPNGVIGGAIAFDGTSDYIDVVDDPLELGTSDLTIEAWFMIDDPSAQNQIVAKGDAGPQHEFSMYVNQNELRAQLADDTGVVYHANSSSAIAADTWYHATAVYDRDGYLKIYLNGTYEGKVDISAESSTVISSGNNLHIGTNNLASSGFLGGKIDEVRILNQTLSDEEIYQSYKDQLAGKQLTPNDYDGDGNLTSDIYDLGVRINTTSLSWVEDYKYGEELEAINGTVLLLHFNNNDTSDSSGLSNHPAPSGGVNCTGGSEQENGKFFGACGFDGVDDQLIMTGGESFNSTNESFTFEAWVKMPRDMAPAFHVISRMIFNATTGSGWEPDTGSDGTYRTRFDTDAGSNQVAGSCAGSREIKDGKWHHVATTYDKGDASTYVDGVLECSTTISGSFGNFTTPTFRVGHQGYGAYFNGTIDEVRVLNRTLSADEIYGNYRRGVSDVKFKAKSFDGSGYDNPRNVLDIGFDGDFKDGSGQGNDGEGHNTTFTEGIFGPALSFEGYQAHAEVPMSDSLRLSDAITISFWINPKKNFTEETASIISTISGEWDSRINIYNSTGQLASFISIDGSNQFMSMGNLPHNNWSHVVYTYDSGSGYQRGYIDGELRVSSYVGGKIDTDGYNIKIGRATSDNQHLNGSLDEVEIFDYALRDAEVKQLYESFQDASAWSGPDPTQACRDDGSCYLALDFETLTGNNLTLDLSNYSTGGFYAEAQVSGASPTTRGKHGTALEFDGVDDYVLAIPDSSLGGKDKTITYWFKSPDIKDEMRIYSATRYVGDGDDPYDGFHYRGKTQIGDNGNLLVARLSYNGGCSATGTTMESDLTLQNDTWYHVAEVYDRTNQTGVNGTAKLYINGVLSASAYHNATCINDDYVLWLGRRKGTGTQHNFNGTLDSFQVYNRSLTATEIKRMADDYFTNSSGEYIGRPHQYVQYRAFLETEDTNLTPIVSSVTLHQNNYTITVKDSTASQTNLSTPVNNTQTSDNTPTLLSLVGEDRDYNYFNRTNYTLGYWSFDQRDQNTSHVYDLAGPNDPGMKNGASCNATGRSGTACVFNGADQYLELSDVSDLNLTASNFAISSWVYLDEVKAGGIISRVSSGLTNPRWTISINPNGSIDFTTTDYDGFATVHMSDGTLTADTWHHVVVMRDSPGSSHIYIDGEYDSGDVGLGIENIDPTTPLRFGYAWVFNGSAYNRYLDGMLDEVAIYRKNLSAAEVASIYHRERTRFETVIANSTDFDAADVKVSLLSINNLSENRYYDDDYTLLAENFDSLEKIRRNNNGSVANCTITPGKFGNACDFDGANNYVDLGTVGGYSDKVTVEAWVKSNGTSGWDDIVAGGCGDLLFALHDSGQIRFGGQCNDPFPVIQYPISDIGDWHHVAGSYDGSKIRIYLDGKMVNESEVSGSFTPGQLYIGSTGGSIEHFNGKIDELRISSIPRYSYENLSSPQTDLAAFSDALQAGTYYWKTRTVGLDDNSETGEFRYSAWSEPRTLEITGATIIINTSHTLRGFGRNITLTANVSDEDTVSAVLAEVAAPGEGKTNYTMTLQDDGLWKYNFTDYANGTYAFRAYSNSSGVFSNSTNKTFQMGINLSIGVRTMKDDYGEDELVNLTDPPAAPLPDPEMESQGGETNQITSMVSGLRQTTDSSWLLILLLSLLLSSGVAFYGSQRGTGGIIYLLIIAALLLVPFIYPFHGLGEDYTIDIANMPYTSDHDVSDDGYNLSFQLLQEPVGYGSQDEGLNLSLGMTRVSGGVSRAPIANKFDGSTTNFGNIPNYQSFCDLILENSTHGKIYYRSCVNIDSLDFDSNVFISHNLIKVNSENLHNSLNSTANISLYSINYGYPKILKNGKPCDDCDILSWDSNRGNVDFNTSSFSNFTVVEGNQSKIANNGTSPTGTNVSIYALVKVQYYNDSTKEWIEALTMVNDTAPRELDMGDTLKLDALFNERYNTSLNSTHESGYYRIFAAATDENDVILQNIYGENISAVFNFTIDLITPQLTLNSPENDSVVEAINITLNWTAIDNLDANPECDLQVNGQDEALSLLAVNGTPTIYNLTYQPKGRYNWSVACRDNALQTNTSQIYYYNVSNHAPDMLANFTVPAYPREGRNVTLGVTAYDLDGLNDISSVNFTLVAPNGSIMLAGKNGTEGDNGNWTVSYNLSSHGTWLWNATIFDEEGASANMSAREIILMEATISLNITEVLAGWPVAVSGHINLSNGTNITDARIEIFADDVNLTNATTDSFGDYNVTILGNSTVKEYTIKVNTTFSGTIGGEGLATLEVKTTPTVDLTGSNFIVEDPSGRPLFMIDKTGHANIRGVLQENAVLSGDENDFIVENATGGPNLILTNPEGDLYLRNSLTENVLSPLNPGTSSFVIENSTGVPVAYVNSTGGMFITGTLTQEVRFE